jgi:hypothetical protein
MNFDIPDLRKQQKTQRITLEIDVVGDEIESEQCEKIANSFTDFVRQIWCLSDPQIAFAISSKVKVQLPKQKTHDQVQLPCANSSGQVK